MTFKRFILIFGLIFLPAVFAYAKDQPPVKAESDQQISDFSLAGYGEKGKKSWDISGKTADIFTETVQLESVEGNLYGKEENVKLTADRGDFNKTSGQVRLEKNVVITTSAGAKLTTDSLDWDRKAQLVSTRDSVNIERNNMFVVASGAHGEPNLKKVALEKDIRMDINPASKDKSEALDTKEKVVVTCDGPLEIDYEKNIATLNNNVRVERSDAIIYSDRMDIFFIAAKGKKGTAESDKKPGLAANKIDKIVASGNVKIIRGENISYSEVAIYNAAEGKIVLSGRPKLVISSTESMK